MLRTNIAATVSVLERARWHLRHSACLGRPGGAAAGAEQHSGAAERMSITSVSFAFLGFLANAGRVAGQVVEEFMSIVDGQVVLLAPPEQDETPGAAASSSSSSSSSGQVPHPVTVDPQASISRIGSRAYPPALAELAVQLRFELAQVWPWC